MVSLPALDLTSDTGLFVGSHDRVLLFSHRRRLVVSLRQVAVFSGAAFVRNLLFDNDIVCATYTRFSRVESDPEVLAVCLLTSAHIYCDEGNNYTVNFPFEIRHAFACDWGLVLERDHSHEPTSTQAYRFFTLNDSFGDLRSITTSSTSVVLSAETLVEFPDRGLNKTRSLCVTFNTCLRSLQVYHVRAAARPSGTTGNNFRVRKNPSMATPNPKLLEDELLYDLGPVQGSANFSSFLSVSMDKKRSSTLLSGVSSIRMGSEASFLEAKPKGAKSPLEFGSLRKDMILSSVESIPTDSRRLQLAVHGLFHDQKEAIVVCNAASKTAKVYIYEHQSSRMLVHQSSFSFPAQHARPLNHPDFPGWLVVLSDPSTIHLVQPFLEIKSPPINLAGHYPAISAVATTCDNLVILRSATKSHKALTLSLVLLPRSKLVEQCLNAWKYLSGSKINEYIWTMWRASLALSETKDEWEALVITLLSIVYPFTEFGEVPCKINTVTRALPNAKIIHDYFDIDYSFLDLLPYIVASLHLIYEETKLDCFSGQLMKKLGFLLTQLTVWMSWPDQWTTFYMIDHSTIDSEPKLILVVLLYDPPNIFHALTCLLEGTRARYLKFSQLVEESARVDALITPRSHIAYRLFEILASSNFAPREIIKAMTDHGLDYNDLDSFPLGISIPLQECFLSCKESAALEWNSKSLELTGRKDLSMMLQSNTNFNHGNHLFKFDEEAKDANLIVSGIFSKAENFIAWDGQSEADRIQVTKLIFDKDRRFYEITKLLHQTRTQTAILPPHGEISEYDLTLLKRELAVLVALRTLSIPLGRAALFYGGRMPFLTEKFPISKFNLTALIAPSMTSIVLSEGLIDPKIMEWGHFHNGVSSGLSISPDSNGISGSWVIFNKPVENNAQHAGFLLGLGLNGHLKKLEEWHIYNYLGPKHPLTSVGLLIGMAASIRGTMDNKLTKVLSVHAVALLPQGANDLNVPIVVQSAGLIGIGLLYLETQHRRMSEILLSQIGGFLPHFEDDEEQEGYRLAAGMSLGLINLGKGDDLRGLNDTHVVDQLLSYAVSMRDSQANLESSNSSSGAILALGFIYLKTKSMSIVKKLEIPSSEQLLEYIKPDVLFLRCLIKNLIMWDPIESRITWIESQIPDILNKYRINLIQLLDSDQIPYFNILGGSCLSLAIKYSSTHDMHARDTLLYYLDLFMSLLSTETTNYDQTIAFNAANQIQSLLALCAAVIMAGSGDLEVFRRLRVLHGQVNRNVQYGNHMAINMALGILFLGGSQYAFGKSNFAIASLIISLYPVFPNGESDHEVHLQALRHFWALAVEPKCLVVRDVNDGSPIKVPVTITYDNGKSENTMTPCLLTRMSQVESIEVSQMEYFNVKISFRVNSAYLEKFRKSLTIYVYEKRNYELLRASVYSLFDAENRMHTNEDIQNSVGSSIKRLLELNMTEPLSLFEKQIFAQGIMRNDRENCADAMGKESSVFDILDAKIQFNRMSSRPTQVEDLRNLNLLFAYMDNYLGNKNHFLSWNFIERLKLNIWRLTQSASGQ